jgi:hypothetical protein
MSNPTTPFNWQMPTNTDLVTDLPADFEVFGQAVASSMADLLGGTSGQILSKATNADMDFTWITNDIGDITAVTATSPLTGGGTSGAITVGIQAASTSQSGAVQLSDSTSTTSSVLASTPTATKAAKDAADAAQTTATAAIPKSTVTTAGDVIYATGSGAVTRLGIGTAGQVLTVNGGGTAPSWATASGSGGMTLLSTTSLTGATTTISSISQSYKDLVILFKDFNVASNTNMLIRLNSDATAANYQQGVFRAASATNSPYGDNSSTGIDLTGYSFKASTNDFTATMTINNYAGTDTWKSITSSSAFITNASDPAVCWNTAAYKTTTAISSIAIYTTVGTWAGGSVLIYGVN